MTRNASSNWLNEVEMAAWLGFVETFADLIRAIESDLTPHGIDLGDYQVFVYLSGSVEGSMKMCDLADALQLTPSGLTRRIDGLVSRGWVERRPSEEDRRVNLAALTSRGKKLIEEVAPGHVESVRRHMIDQLTVSELKAFASGFSRIRTGLDEE